MLAFQAYIDESVQDGVWVFAGYVAGVDDWARFSEEWEKMLPMGTLAPDDTYHFKMADMGWEPERLARVPGFYRIIERHVVHALSVSFNEKDMAGAKARIHVPNTRIEWSWWDNAYFTGFRVFMDFFHSHKRIISETVSAKGNGPSIPADAVVDFYFDDHTDKKKVREAWDSYVESRPPWLRSRFGAEPRFENDRVYLPLQAADLWAWWVRKWAQSGDIKRRIMGLDFGAWQGEPIARTHTLLNEEHWVKIFADMLWRQLPKGALIFDHGGKDLLAIAGVGSPPMYEREPTLPKRF